MIRVVLDGQGMQRAKSLASEIVRVNKEREIEKYRLERERQSQATRESFESLGRAFRNVQNAYIEGFYKPINNAIKAMGRGYHN